MSQSLVPDEPATDAKVNAFERVVVELERLNKEWVVHGVPRKKHKYGRVPGEKEIRLWSLPRHSAEFLRFLVIVTGAQTILEIGTGAGYSTLWLASGAKETGGRVTTIELFPPKLELARRFFHDAEFEQYIDLREGEAMEITAAWDSATPIDMIFLDADKENYAVYLNRLRPHLRKGSLIVADNAGDYRKLMLEYIDMVTTQPVFQSHFLGIDNGLMLTIYKGPEA